MLNLTKKIAVVAVLVTIYSGQVAFGSHHNNEAWNESNKDIKQPSLHDLSSQNGEGEKLSTVNAVANVNAVVAGDMTQPVYINRLPPDVMKLVLAKASKGNHPIDLLVTCKYFCNLMLGGQDPKPELKFGGLSPFMQQCINMYWAERFHNGILRYTSPGGRTVVDLKFSDVLSDYERTKGTFNISACGDAPIFLRLTLSIDEFLKVRGENENLTVILFATRQMIESLIDTSAKLFAGILKDWDPSFPVGLFFKWGNDDKFLVRSLTCRSLKELSTASLFQNWKAANNDEETQCCEAGFRLVW